MPIDPVTLDLQPCENGTLLYQRIAPGFAGGPSRAMVYFMMTARNNMPHAIRLKMITILFHPIGNPAPRQFQRNVLIGSGDTEDIGLVGGEEFALDLPTQPFVKIRLLFEGLDAQVERQYGLAQHSRVWAFFAKPEPDNQYGEYITLPGQHVGGGGGQHFGYDVGALGFDSFGQPTEKKDNFGNNSSLYIWGRPIYAMADGVVVKAVDEIVDNPAPKRRSFGRTEAFYQGDLQISSVAVANLSGQANDVLDRNRFFVAYGSGENVRGLVLEQNADGSDLQVLSGTMGPSLSGGPLSAVGISRYSAITAHRSGGDIRLTYWATETDGSSLEVRDTAQLPLMSQARIVKLTSNRVAVLGKTLGGTLKLTVHQFSDDGEFDANSIGEDYGGQLKDFALLALSSSRLAAAIQTLNDRLKVIVWDIGIGGVTTGNTSNVSLNRTDEKEGLGTISEVALAAEDEKQIVTAVKTSSGEIKLIVWDVLANGTIERRGDVTTEQGSNVEIEFFKTSSYMLGYRLGSGKLRLESWELSQNEDTLDVSLRRLYKKDTDGQTNLFAMERVLTEQPTIVTALRTQSGVLKVILWQYTGSNLLYILHGDEIIHFVHLQQGSIPDALMQPGTPVYEGQMVGRVGHSGKSSGPHLHIHASSVRADLAGNTEQIIEELAIGNSVGDLRPMHFRDVRMMAMANPLQSGWENNPMTLVQADGAYFTTYAVWPAPGHVAQEPQPARTAVVTAR
jgi:hypothetical protein